MVPIILAVRIRPGIPVLREGGATRVTVDVRVTDDSGVDAIESWLHAADGMDGKEIKQFEPLVGVRNVYRATVGVRNDAHTGRWKTDFFVMDTANNMALRRGKAAFYVKRDTSFTDFNASPERVRRGGALTVSGKLLRFEPGAGRVAYAEKRVQILFKRHDRTRWVEKAVARTGRRGLFSVAVTAGADGAWRAHFPGTDNHVARYSDRDAIDVR